MTRNDLYLALACFSAGTLFVISLNLSRAINLLTEIAEYLSLIVNILNK
jgi:hypothetical protein